MTEDEMAGWHHLLDGYGFGWTLGVGDGQGSLACCHSWGCKESDMTDILNFTEPQIPSPSMPPLPLATTSLISVSVSPFLFCRQVYLCHI